MDNSLVSHYRFYISFFLGRLSLDKRDECRLSDESGVANPLTGNTRKEKLTFKLASN